MAFGRQTGCGEDRVIDVAIIIIEFFFSFSFLFSSSLFSLFPSTLLHLRASRDEWFHGIDVLNKVPRFILVILCLLTRAR
ncbi:hypothetical protein F4809DRAFT_603800 [Biscogniauxia mediterranea]|nr:hypothetical protein F4809DRAFT_603800 [Biscogniauxia mediterranea]